MNLQLEEAQEARLFGGEVVLEEVGYPAFYVRFRTPAGHDRLLRFDCEGYDTLPLDIEPVDSITRAPLNIENWMRRDNGDFPVHSVTKRPFLCVPFARSYFTYHGHDPVSSGQPWDFFRADNTIRDVVSWIAGRFASGTWA